MNEVFFSFSQITYIGGGLSDDFLNIIIIIPSVVVMRIFSILDKAGEGEKKKSKNLSPALWRILSYRTDNPVCS